MKMAFRNTLPDLTENEWKFALCMAVSYDLAYGPQPFVNEADVKTFQISVRVVRRLRKLTPTEIQGVLEVWKKVHAYMQEVAYGRLPRSPKGIQYKKLIAQWSAEKRSPTRLFCLSDE